MKRIFTISAAALLFMLLVLAPAAAQAQPPREKLESMKIAYLTREVDLTPEEAKVFWPVYNKHQDILQGLRKESMQQRMDTRTNWEDLSDKEVEAAINKMIDLKQRELDAEKAMITDMREVLPVRKVAKFIRAEHEFRRVLLERLQERRGGGPGGRGGPHGGFR